jgi:hypothetical protein
VHARRGGRGNRTGKGGGGISKTCLEEFHGMEQERLLQQSISESNQIFAYKRFFCPFFTAGTGKNGFHGFIVSRIRGFIVSWIHGFVDSRIRGFMDSLIRGFTDS